MNEQCIHLVTAAIEICGNEKKGKKKQQILQNKKKKNKRSR